MQKPLVIITGGCGYIGSHTAIDLIQNGYEVVSIDNFSRSVDFSLQCIENITGKKIKNHAVDLCDLNATEEIFSLYPEVAGVIHFAAFKSVPESVKSPLLYYNNNINSLVNVISCLTRFNIKNLVFSSSCSVYGDIKDLPVSEQTALSEPKSPYAATKVMGEKIVADCSEAYNLNAINLRYFNPVGAHITGRIGELPLQRPDNLFPIMTQTAVGRIDKLTVFGGKFPTRDGSCIRDYVHVSDIARAHVLALKYMLTEKKVYEIINLGTGNGVSVLEAINEFEKVSGVQLNYSIGEPREGDVVEIYSDASKALEILGWKTDHDLTDMVMTAWQWQLFLEKNFYKEKTNA
jgi:UDP-glucose 4-epimerase